MNLLQVLILYPERICGLYYCCFVLEFVFHVLSIFLFLLAKGMAQAPKPPSFFKAPEGVSLMSTDLHIHTVFSDGSVWPSIRIEEARREGLDLIAMTEHL